MTSNSIRSAQSLKVSALTSTAVCLGDGLATVAHRIAYTGSCASSTPTSPSSTVIARGVAEHIAMLDTARKSSGSAPRFWSGRGPPTLDAVPGANGAALPTFFLFPVSERSALNQSQQKPRQLQWFGRHAPSGSSLWHNAYAKALASTSCHAQASGPRRRCDTHSKAAYTCLRATVRVALSD